MNAAIFPSQQYVIAFPATAIVVTQKLDELNDYVLENKGQILRTLGVSGNLFENKTLSH